MTGRYLLLLALFGLPAESGWSQSRIGEWRQFTSTLSPQALAYHEGRIYLATGGGVLIYDLETEQFTELGVSEGLVYTDLNYLTVSGDWLWLGGAAPRGVIQVINLISGELRVIDLQLDEIGHIVAEGDRAFAAFRQGIETGILELRWDGTAYSFADTYRNFPLATTTILDLDMWNDSLFVTMTSGVLGNNFRTANLKDPLTWRLMTPTGQSGIVQYLVDSTGHYFMIPREFHRREPGGGWTLQRGFGGGVVRNLMHRGNGDFVISYSRYLLFLTPSGSLFASPLADGAVLSYVDSEEEDVGFAAVKDHGLARYHHPTRTWTVLAPNTMAGQGYSAVLKLSSGELVAAGLRGIARFDGQTWYNLMDGYDSYDGPEGDRIHGNAQVTSSATFLADTIYYRGKQSWNMLELADGDLLVGFKGNPHKAGGILRVNFADVAGYATYDTAGGRLDGLLDAANNFVFITVRNMAADPEGNIWIANPFSPLNENVVAVFQADGEWTHFSTVSSRDNLNMAPTEFAFDTAGRVWIASEVNSFWGSPGGIAVLDYGGTLEDQGDDQWWRLSARLLPEHSNTVWSLAFDRQQVLWIVSPNGVMGYTVDADLRLLPFTSVGPFLSEIPFVEGSKIRVDAQNNKWITTPQHGLWVLLDNTTFWPSVDGFNSGNSPLPSDEVLDIYLDDEEGLAYLATSKGLAVLKMPFKRTVADYNDMVIFPSPFRIPPEAGGRDLIIDGLRQGSDVKIFTVSGSLVRVLSARRKGNVAGYQATWDGKNNLEEWVGSGVYLISAYLEKGTPGIGKVAVIRR